LNTPEDQIGTISGKFYMVNTGINPLP
jgi:hypothetical protein